MAIEQILIDSQISPLAGVDEAGRGACAGPLVVAAVILKDPFAQELNRVRDSKEIQENEREQLFHIVVNASMDFSIIVISSEEVDARGVHAANIDGMRRAVLALTVIPKYVLTDGYAVPGLGFPSLGVWKGDQVVHSISAASILAKVTRDHLMREFDASFSNYGFAIHKGYSTSAHMDAIREFGALPIHRRSFANVATIINNSK